VVGRVVWRWPTPRRLFVAWQRTVNGFELVGRLRGGVRALEFRCTHYQPDTKQCDSYESRPFMCRQYPRVLLDQPWPELFDDCSYALVDREGAGLADALDATDLSPEARDALKRKLRLVSRPEEK
jgi:Fe-S-cluster containining protein